MTQTAPLDATSVSDHPMAGDVNAMHQAQLSKTEKMCKRIADATGAPIALVLAIIVQLSWVAVGMITRWDPYPFAFLLTCSNILQLILIFVIAVAQKQSSQHDELRAEADHDAISRLLYHQQLQETFLERLTEKLGIEIGDLRKVIKTLASEG